jgi:hypothetical protein
VVIAGSGNTIGNGSRYNTIINGFNNTIYASAHVYSFILGGQNNEIGSLQSIGSGIIGGDTNLIQGSDNSILIGGYSNTFLAYSDNSIIMGGTGNTIDNSDFSTIIGGVGSSYVKIEDSTNSTIIGLSQGNQIPYIRDSFNSAILAGEDHQIDNSYNSVIIGGQDSDIKPAGGDELIYDSSIIGGRGNVLFVAGERSSILGGSGNTISGYYSSGIKGTDNTIIGGVGNQMLHIDRSAIIAGTDNYMEAEGGIMNSVIAGGKDNKIDLVVGNEDGSFIAGGHSNTISGFVSGDLPIISSIIGGSGNTIDDISNSHIIGTFDVTATTENTLYVPNLEVRGQAYTPIYDNLTGGTAFIPYWDNSNVQILTLSGNTNVSGGTSTMKGGSAYTMIIKQSNGGSHTITWDSTTYKWEAGSAPTLSVADGSVDIITFICDGTSLYGLIAKDFQ